MSSTKTKFFTPGITLVLMLALFIMAGAWSAAYYFARSFEDDTCQRYNEKQLEHVVGISRNLSQILSLIEKDLEYLASLPDLQSTDKQRILPHLNAFYRHFDGYIYDISRIDVSGNVLVNYNPEAAVTIGKNAFNCPATVQVFHTHKTALGGPFTTLKGTKGVALDMPIFTYDASTGAPVFTGTLSCLIELDSWGKTYVTPYDTHLNSFTWIINDQHKIVAHSNFKLIGESWEHIAQASIIDPEPETTDRNADREFLTRALYGQAGKEQVKLGSLGNEYQLIAYAPLRVAGTLWLVISNAPRKAVLKPLNDNLSKISVVMILFGGLLTVMVGFAMYAEQRKLGLERDMRQSLQQSEKKYRLLIERSNDGIIVTSPDGFIKLTNRRIAEMLGYSEEELLGRNLRELIPILQQPILESEWQKHQRGENSSYELELLPKNGDLLTMIVSGSPVFNRNNEQIANLSIFTDITDKKRTEEEIRRRNEELLAVNAIAEAVNYSLVLMESFAAAACKVREVLNLDGCLIFSLNEKTHELVVSASVGFSAQFVEQPAINRIPLMQDIIGKVVETGEVLIFEDIAKTDYHLCELARSEGIVSVAFVSIKAGPRCYGVIGCMNRFQRIFSERDINLLRTIGQTIGLAVEKARLYEMERRRSRRLETIYQVSDKMTALLELEELLPILTKLIHETFNYYNVNIFLADKATGELIFTAGCGGYQSPEPVGVRLKPSEGIVGTCFQSGDPILVDDVLQAPNFLYIESLPETKSELAVPLLSRGAPIGVLDVQSSVVSAFDEEDVLTLQVLAEQIGVAVENAQLYERVKHSLEEVRKSQAFFAKIVLESPLSTFITDSYGTCILINQSALALLGRDLAYDEVIGKYNLMRDPPFAASPIAEQIRTVMAGEVVQFTVDLPAPLHWNGPTQRDTITLRATIFPLMDDISRVANIVAKFEDLTEKKQLEEALIQAQKMESIGTLAGGIAHDFNNILGGVLGYTSFIKTKMAKVDPLYRYIDIIESSARRAADLTQQLLAFARGGKYRVQSLALNLLVKEAVQLIASAIDKNINVKLDLWPTLPAIEGDGSQIIQTIVNICINARDAMPAGGQLTISTSLINTNALFVQRHPGAQSGGYISLIISDTGMGMTEETKQRIFEPFFTTKKDKKGTGLGLAMVYGIVKNHGGYIDVESTLGVGTTFSIYLPISEKQIEETVTRMSGQFERGSETILVAEDEEIIRELIVEMLDSGGYKVIPAGNGREALDIYRQRAHEIDLVILDMMMPEVGGHEAFQQLKKINPNVKVLLSSGYSQDGLAQQLLNEGVLGFIQKPYAVKDLLDKVRFIIDTV
ncbi:MAG: PAS domain S-box protein [Acidobacteriota bacterium]